MGCAVTDTDLDLTLHGIVYRWRRVSRGAHRLETPNIVANVRLYPRNHNTEEDIFVVSILCAEPLYGLRWRGQYSTSAEAFKEGNEYLTSLSEESILWEVRKP